jgi:glycosyltransferase XagB
MIEPALIDFQPDDLAPGEELGDSSVLSRVQFWTILVVLAVVGTAFAAWPIPTLTVLTALLMLLYTAANGLKLLLIHRSLDATTGTSRAFAVHARERTRATSSDLPVYTILLPLYREGAVVGQLVDGIARLDYPSSRLDVKLLLEADDEETRAAIDAIDLPNHFEVLTVSGVGPKAKPRACNHGLAHARGEYLVIYDAEDRPEPSQLRDAVAAFAHAEPEIVCFQARLNYFNRTHNILTRWFTAEYSVWFDQFLPGLQALDVAIPLGGTSNHFTVARLRELRGWNPFNVTEDADLGVRIFLRGWKTAILESTTYEEATSRLYNWIRQRSRWVKGYLQTYFFQMRHPVRVERRMGAKAFVAFQLFFASSSLCLVLNPVFWILTVVWFATEMHWIEAIFPWPILYLGLIGLFVGNLACILSFVSGCFGRRHYEDVKWAFFAPLYWILMSIAAWKAVFQLFYKPMFWEKTEHGFCKYDEAVLHAPLTNDALGA